MASPGPDRRGRCYFIATSWWGGGASVPLHFRALARELIVRGHKVVMLIDGRAAEAEDPAGAPCVRVWPSRRPTRLKDALFLNRLIAVHRPDCLIANFGSENVMTLVGRLAGVPVRVAWYHTLSRATDIEAPSQLRVGLLRLRKRIVYRFNTHFVPVTEAARADLRRVFGIPSRKCTVLPNSLADPQPMARDVGGAGERIVCVAGLIRTKGQDVLVRALARIRQRHPDVVVDFLGSGPLREEYAVLARELGVADMCRFHGAVPHDEVLRVLAASTVNVLPSRSDNCPLAVIESLACGIPVVAAAAGGIPEMIRDGVDGYLFPPGDDRVLAEKLEIVLSDGALRAAMSRNARRRFLDCFEQGKVVRQQADWLETITRPASGPVRTRSAGAC